MIKLTNIPTTNIGRQIPFSMNNFIKKMKNISFLPVLSFLCMAQLAMAQPTFYLSPDTLLVNQNDKACFEVKTRDFTELLTASFTIRWDTAVANGAEVTPTSLHPELTNLTVADFEVNNGEGYLTFDWSNGVDCATANPSQGVTLVPDHQVLFEICFDAVGNNGSQTEIYFSDDPMDIAAQRVNANCVNIMPPTGFTFGASLLIATGPTNVCVGQTVTYSIPNDPCNVSYNWNLPFGYAEPISPTNLSKITVIWFDSASPVEICVEVENSCTSTFEEFCHPVTVVTVVAEAGMSPVVNCSSEVYELDATGSSAGPGYTYQWSSNFGVVISNDTTLNPLVWSAGDWYYLTVTHDMTGCTATDSVWVDEMPGVLFVTIDPATIECGQSEITLNAQISGNSTDFAISWIADPGNIVSVGTGLNPVINEPGEYCITVYDWILDCLATDCVTVQADNSGNVVAEAGPSVSIDCSGNVVPLDGTDSFSPTGAVLTYEWTAATCCIEDGADTPTPIVYQQGWYFLKVTDTVTGCMATDSVYVEGIEIFIEPATFPCGESEIILQSDVSFPNPDFPPSFFWSTTDGVILSGSGALDPVIGSPGTYCLTAVTGGQYCYDEKCIEVEGETNCSTVSGNVLVDGNMNCQTDVGEMPLSGWLVQAVGDNGVGTFFGTTDADGFYSIAVIPGVFYTVTLVTSNATYFVCGNDIVSNVVDANNNAIINFSVGEVAPCPILTVDLSNNILRRCADNNFFYVNYCNEGTETAEDAYVEITLDPDLILVHSPFLYTNLGNNVYSFEIGDLAPDQCGGFWFKAFLACDVEIAETHCSEAHIFPDEGCFPTNPLWSGASLELRASCTDSTRFTVTNVGTAALTIPAGYVVIEDAVMYRPGEIKALQPNESMEISMPANGSTWRLEVEQEPYHPFPNVPVAWMEGCGTNSGGTFSRGFVNQQYLGDPELYMDTDCTVNQAPFDPNDKQGFPLGHSEEHFIKKDNPIEYMIRFQNTGNDTAFNVVLLDTISEKLDLCTFRPGASSHEYNWEVYGTGILKFEFPNINLPDSMADLAGSQGFVQFIISPKENVLPLQVIENSADIYFDFEAPITTNTTLHTIEKPKVFGIGDASVCSGDWYNGHLLENDTMLVETHSFQLYDSLHFTFINILGNVAASVSADIVQVKATILMAKT